jgi:Fic family protein
MSSICKVLGVAYAPKGFTKDVRAEGVAQMVLAVRRDWKKPLSEALLKRWHSALLKGRNDNIAIGEFRSHAEPMRVIRRHADGTVEIRYEAPPSEQVPGEIRKFLKMWKTQVEKPVDVALKCAMIHTHFESIHPFEDGNGRVGRALVAKALAEGLGLPLVLPVSTVIARHRAAYYEEINEASRSLDWTNWAAFFIPVLTEMMTSFVAAMRFVKAKRDYLTKYESGFSERARKVVLRMFEDGEEGAKGVLSAAKWMRMAKVSKPTAIGDLQTLEKLGAIVRVDDGIRLEYGLSGFTVELINEPLNGELDERLLKLAMTHPGVQLSYMKSVVGKSLATVKRAIAALVKAGLIEHRGSKKTGGYYVKEVVK